MDWTTVAIAFLGVAGTLGGIWLGQWLQLQHRHDETKVRAYVEYLALIRAAVEGVAGSGPLDVDGFRRRMYDLTYEVQVLGGKGVVRAAAQAQSAILEWMEGRGGAADPLRRRNVEEALADVLIEVRRELGSGDL